LIQALEDCVLTALLAATMCIETKARQTTLFSSKVSLDLVFCFVTKNVQKGGGWCYNFNDCIGRSTTQLGSSSNWPATMKDDEAPGLFSAGGLFYLFAVAFGLCSVVCLLVS
jgi:hypothetical protein